MKKSFFAAAAAVFLFVFGCKTPPTPPSPPQPNPSTVLFFTGINAPDIDHVGLDFTLKAENPRSDPVRAKIDSFWV
jgi:hypothetical protein